MKYQLPKSAQEAFQLVNKNIFKPFDREDWDAFSGCTSEAPQICYLENDEDENGMIIILDGESIYFQTFEMGEGELSPEHITFTLKEE